MSIDPSILRAMQAAGASIDIIIAAVEADAALEDHRKAEKRAKDAERQRNWRAENAPSRSVTVTPCDTADVTDDPSLSLPPKEINSNPPAHSHPEKQTPRARKGHRLPEDWQPGPLPVEIATAVAAWPSGALERELARFRDWAASATGPNAVKSNWDAAWRNWLRKAQDEGRYGERAKQPTGARSIDGRDGVARALDRRLGLDDPSGSTGRCDTGEGGGTGPPPTLRLAAM